MKTNRTIILSILFILFSFGLGVLSLSASAPQPQDPSYTIQSFRAGKGPTYLTFDGDNIWVTNTNGASITKLRASDGALLGIFPFAHDNPEGIAWDGANIWIA